MENGYILISRGLLDSDIFASQKLLKIWIWCLCKANFKDRSVPLKIGKGETIIQVKRGSFIFGRFKAEEELFIDGSTIYKSIKKLEEMGMVDISSSNQYSIITICNYDTYQQSCNYKIASKEQQNDKQVTTKGQASNTTKERKTSKERKKEYNYDFVSDKFKVIFFEWIQYKKERNEMYKTQTSLQTCYNNLLKFSKDNPETAKEIVNNSIGNNWSGFFPLKENNKQKQHSQVLTEQQFYEPLKRE